MLLESYSNEHRVSMLPVKGRHGNLNINSLAMEDYCAGREAETWRYSEY